MKKYSASPRACSADVYNKQLNSVETVQINQHKGNKRSYSSNSYFIPHKIFVVNSIISRIIKELDPQLFTRKSKIHKWIKIKIVTTVIICCILAVIYWNRTFAMLQFLLSWIGRHPVIGGMLYIVLYSICTVFCVPGSALAIGAGYIYHHSFGLIGLAVASVIVWIGASFGAIFAFLNSKYLFRDYATTFARKNVKFRLIQHLIKEKGFLFAFLIRISPTLPFLATNYVLGCSEISLFHYSMALFGIFPGCVLYASFGTTLSQLSDLGNAQQSISETKWTFIFLIIGIILGTIGLIVFAVVARKKFVFYMKQYRSIAAKQTENVTAFSPASLSLASMSFYQRKALFDIDDQAVANEISNCATNEVVTVSSAIV
eukprot:401577_1